MNPIHSRCAHLDSAGIYGVDERVCVLGSDAVDELSVGLLAGAVHAPERQPRAAAAQTWVEREGRDTKGFDILKWGEKLG